MTALAVRDPNRIWRVRLTAHALARYTERVRPGLELAAAHDDIARIAQHGQIEVDPPEWLARTMRQGAERYLQIGDVVFPLREDRNRTGVWDATTCIARSGMSDLARSRRNVSRQWRRARRRGYALPLAAFVSTKEHR